MAQVAWIIAYCNNIFVAVIITQSRTDLYFSQWLWWQKKMRDVHFRVCCTRQWCATCGANKIARQVAQGLKSSYYFWEVSSLAAFSASVNFFWYFGWFYKLPSPGTNCPLLVHLLPSLAKAKRCTPRRNCSKGDNFKYICLPTSCSEISPLIFLFVMSLCEARNSTTFPFSFLIGTISNKHQNGDPEIKWKI